MSAQHTPTPHDRRVEVLRATPDWKVHQREDGLFVVSRIGGEAMRGRFRTGESASHAAALGNAETWLRLAINVAPETINLPGHIAYYARVLVEDAGMGRSAAIKQCEAWAADELAFRAARSTLCAVEAA